MHLYYKQSDFTFDTCFNLVCIGVLDLIVFIGAEYQ